MEGCDAVVNFAAETHVDRSLLGDASFIETDVRGVFVLLEEAKRRGREEVRPDLDRRGLRHDRRGLLHRGVAAEPAQSLRRVQGGRRPSGLLLLGLLRDAGDHHPRVQQLRAVPVPGEAHPALRDQRHRRPAAAALRRRPERPRLALRARPCRGDRLPARRRQARRDLQRRRRQRGREHRRSPGACSRSSASPRPSSASSTTGPGTTAATRSTRRSSRELGFRSSTPFEEGLAETVRWYRDHEEWWRPIKERDAAYREFYRSQYEQRLATSSATAKAPG